MQNKNYVFLVTCFFWQQIILGAEAKQKSFAGLPAIVSDARRDDECVIDILPALYPVPGEIVQEIKGVLRGTDKSRRYRSMSPIETKFADHGGSNKLAEAVLRLAHVADQANERHEAAAARQAADSVHQAKVAKCDRYLTYSSAVVNGIIGAVSLGVSIYSVVKK